MAECQTIQGYLAHKKTPTPLGPPQDPMHSPTVGSCGGAVSYERGTTVWSVIQPQDQPSHTVDFADRSIRFQL